MRIKEALGTLLKGLAMGIADTIPGVSGGTIAFITGIYDRLITSIRDVVDIPTRIIKSKSLRPIMDPDWWFLILLGTGILSAIWIASRSILWLLALYPGPVFGFFVGLILASAAIILPLKDDGGMPRLWLIIGAAIGLGIAVLPAAPTTKSLLYVGLAGMLAISAMLLPGISGAYVLLLLGLYTTLLESIHQLPASWPIISAFIIGAGLGVILLSNLLAYVLTEHRTNTLYALVGLLLGGTVSPLRSALDGISTPSQAILAIAAAALGAFIVWIADRLTRPASQQQ